MRDKTNEIRELLISADKLIRAQKLGEALEAIDKVCTLDVRNVYARAYGERIKYLLSQQPHQETPVKRTTEEKKDIASPHSEIQKTEQRKQEKTSPDNSLKRSDNVLKSKSEAPKIVGQFRRSAAMFDAYKALLTDIWKDGIVASEEQTRIDSMRETFDVSIDEHNSVEKEVRIASYLSEIKVEFRKGVTNFEPLRKKFNISNQEQIDSEPKILVLIQSLQSNGSVLILDDEQPFLNLVKELLTEKGYYCFTTTSGEEGLQLLETMTPDIVLCDVNFSKPHMSGFAFYERFRSIEKFVVTPFIFLSGLDQEILIRTGKKLGADDYLTKPIDTELLLATLEGKLRRLRELRRSLPV
jgi:CheY-like chemotaxis protein